MLNLQSSNRVLYNVNILYYNLKYKAEEDPKLNSSVAPTKKVNQIQKGMIL